MIGETWKELMDYIFELDKDIVSKRRTEIINDIIK